MGFLIKKMVRSVRDFKMQFISVLLLAILSVIVYSGLEGVWNGMKQEFNKFVDNTNLADEWVMASYFTDDDVENIKKLDGVSDVSLQTRLTLIKKDKDNLDTYISFDTVGNENISQMHVMEGEEYSSTKKDSVWISQNYAEENDIAVGDNIKLYLGNSEIEAKVAGLVLSAERTHFVGTNDYYSPNHQQYGYGFVSDELFGKIGVNIPGNLLEIKSSDSAVKSNINDILGERFLAYYDRASLPDVSFMSNQVNNLRKISILFSTLFILLSVLSMNTTIKRIIDSQSSDIAALKALGFSNKSLIIYYSMYGFFVSIIGTSVGFFCSMPFSKVIQKTQKFLYSLPSWNVTHTIGSAIIIALIIVLCTVTSVFAAKKTMVGLPAEFKKNEVKHNKVLLLERITGLWDKMSFGLKWACRDATSHKTRILLGIVSVCGSFMLLMAGFGTPDSIAILTNKTYDDEFVYTNKISLNSANTPEDSTTLQNELGGQLIETIQSNVYANGNTDECWFKPVTIFTDGDYVNLKTLDNKEIINEGIYATEGMANTLDLKIGDTVELSPSFGNKKLKMNIAGIIPSSMPQSFYVKSEAWEEAGGNFRPSHLLTGEIDEDAVRDDVRVSQIISREQQKTNLEHFRSAMLGVFMLMRCVALVLVVIVLYNLSTLSFLERSKEYNTFRVLGFHYHEIRKLASVENVIILVLGSIIGLPFGFKFLSIYCNTFSNDTLVIYPHISTPNFITVCCIVVFCTVLTTLLLSLKIKKIDMVQALKER